MLLNCGTGEDSCNLDCKEIKPVNHKGNQPWIFTGRPDAEAETQSPILWPPDAKKWLIGKDSDAGRDWGQEKGTTEDEMVGWHHWLNEHESEQTPGDSEGRVSLEYCSSWVREQSDTTEWLSMGTSTKEIIEKWFIFSFSIGLGA